MNLDWLMGFIEGEGCFCVSIIKCQDRCRGLKPRLSKIGLFQVMPRFIIGQQKGNAAVIDKIVLFLKENDITCLVGNITAKKTGVSSHTIQIVKLDEMVKLCKLLEHAQWHSIKYDSFIKFKQVIQMMQKREHLNPDGLVIIAKLAQTMNSAKGNTSRRREVLTQILDLSFLKT